MLSIQNNILALNAGRQLNVTTNKKAKGAEKLSSGYRINRAADDAAGLAISEKMRYRIRGLRQGAENTQDGISWVQIGDGALEEINDMINRITELSVKAATETLTDQDRRYIDREIQALKIEINRISQTTTFNELPIFDNSNFNMTMAGCPTDLEIFDAAYDAATGEVSFGGFIFDGERVTWNKVNPDMVTMDSNGQQIFKGGDYTYTTSDGKRFLISCEDGAEVPELARVIEMSADVGGILIDGRKYAWSSLIDDAGKACTADNIHSGSWTMDYYGAKINFTFGAAVSSYEDMAKQINNATANNVNFSWKIRYSGNVNEQAVDVKEMPKITITNAIAKTLSGQGGYDFWVRADENGIWMEDSSGTKIGGSDMTWKDMEITSWDSGSDIDGHKMYSYSMNNSDLNIAFSFQFTLSSITSLDSVIDGLDGMRISSDGVETHYEIGGYAEKGGNIIDAKSAVTPDNIVTFEDEVRLGRDYSQPTPQPMGKENITVDGQKAELTFEGTDGSDVLSFEGDTKSAESTVSDALGKYLEFVEKKKIAALLAGQDPDNFEFKSLDQLVGEGNITTSGRLDGTVTLTDDMVLTDGEGASHNKPGEIGRTYPCAFIDFANIEDLSVLDEVGFNSTCNTCDKHYTIIFKNGLDSGVEKTEENEYRYRYSEKYSQKDGNWNYTLEIDINSLREKGLKGEDLAAAIVEIASAAFDFHYTQYAAKDSTLYIYDNRTNPYDDKATFDTKPYEVIDQCDFHVTLDSTDGSHNGAKVGLDYTYNFADAADRVKVEWEEAQNPDPTTGTYYIKNQNGTYTKWNGDPTSETLYSIKVSYLDSDGNGLQDMEEAVKDYAHKAVSEALEKTSVDLTAKDDSYLKLNGNENENVAVRAQFESIITSGAEDGIKIKHSNKDLDFTFIPRFSVNTVTLGLTRAGCETKEQAQRTLNYLKQASTYVGQKRAIFGACQNRLEHTYNNNRNAEENMEATDSRIRDTDIAKTMVDHANQNIVEQAGASILSQANQQRNFIISLLR